MNRILHFRQSSLPCASRTLKSLGLVAALALAAPAMATTLTFESLAPEAYNSGITLAESGYSLSLLEGPVAAAYGYSGATGIVLNGKDPYSCDVAGCPSNSGNYLGIVNDGAVKLGTSSGNSSSMFQLKGLDYAFLAPLDSVANGSYGELQLTGAVAGGGSVSLSLALPGQDSSGKFTFTSAVLGSFSNYTFTSVTINACIYDDGLSCVNSLEAPAMNLAQFGVDNIYVSAVPEPDTYLSMLLGLGVLGLLGRRQRRNAAGNAARPTIVA